ncbi:hypothetical protein CTAYLR_006061 [Chrysophaeum taylorii]|uniref:Glycoside hydrolase family 5 domain-containing protein n=1 Tax=Chrysophaeum taylorii TaxID=2483200 RepID=A0AAD7UJE6_9STRA|nr:hypothetical protein CTAYLR_006061 [Chrysophaeum taylorii]
MAPVEEAKELEAETSLVSLPTIETVASESDDPPVDDKSWKKGSLAATQRGRVQRPFFQDAIVPPPNGSIVPVLYKPRRRSRCCVFGGDDGSNRMPWSTFFAIGLGALVSFIVVVALIARVGHNMRSGNPKDNRHVTMYPTLSPSTVEPTSSEPSMPPTISPAPTLTPAPTPPETTAVPSTVPTPDRANPPGSIVAKYGLLEARNTRLVSQVTGTEVQLKGMSLFWTNTGWEGHVFYTEGVVESLVNNWNISIIRCAMGVEEEGGYIDYETANKLRVLTVVDAAIRMGIYVIIDWHTHYAQNYLSEAVRFFQDVATVYSDMPNVIFEIYNEPLLETEWDLTIKPYAETVVESIRRTGSENLILVGTRSYSQRVDEASRDPIDDINIAYVFHFYAASHGEWLRDYARAASNVTLFCSEWGSVSADGSGNPDEDSVREWIDFMDERSISHVNWVLNDKNEGASALKPGSSIRGVWTEEDYTDSGLLAREIISETGSYAPG